jgi:hypothetical protein
VLWKLLGLLELLDAVAVAALNGTKILRTFFGLLSRGVPARSRGKAASGVMSTIVTPRTGPEQSRPNRRHCRQKSSVSSHLVPLSACRRRDSAGSWQMGLPSEEAHLDAPSPTLVTASAAHSPGSHRSYEPPQAGLPSGGAMSLSNRLPHRALVGRRIPMGWLAFDAVADALLSRAEVGCDTKMFF